jgi:hypothetical protein
MTFNTGNPIGSTDARDRSDNSENLDLAVNSLALTFEDRFGVTRDTLEGIYQKSAYYRAGTFDAGYTLTNNRQTLAYGNSEYSWSGSFGENGKQVPSSSTPETTGGIGAGAWIDRTDAVLRSQLANQSGLNLVSTGSFAFYLADAPGDGVTDATASFSAAAATAHAYGVQLVVKRPTVSYLLNSNPTIPNNLSIDCNLSWFSGAGRLPVHQFVSLSEGVDPRVFDIAEVSYMETTPNEDKRKWAVVGWVNYKNAPLYADTRTDAVGVDGRGLTSVANGRVWGLLGLAQMDPGVSGTAQALGGEVDVNQNAVNNWEFDGPLPAKGVVVVSGGTKSPETGVMIQATRRPETDPLVDNRFYCGMRFYRNAYTAFGIHFDDTCGGVALRVPDTAVAVRVTNGNHYNFDFRMDPVTHRGQLWCPLDKAIDVLYVDGSQIFEFTSTYNRSHKPFAHKTRVAAMGGVINASAADVHVITDNVTISSISGGFDGQEITLINATGANVIVNQGSNMRMAGGTFTMTPNDTLKFICAAPTWFEVSRSSSN